jgi:hypothetical protein
MVLQNPPIIYGSMVLQNPPIIYGSMALQNPPIIYTHPVFLYILACFNGCERFINFK